MDEPKRRGRRTKEEEALDYLRSIGKNIDDIPDVEYEIPDPETMLREFEERLYREMRNGNLNNTSLVNGLKAIASLAITWREQNGPKEVVVERGVDEILGDAGLPRERRVDIGREEIDRLRARTSALELVVAQIEGAA